MSQKIVLPLPEFAMLLICAGAGAGACREERVGRLEGISSSGVPVPLPFGKIRDLMSLEWPMD